MVDYSEAFLQLDKNLRSVYELMLKGKKEEAVILLEEMAYLADVTSKQIANENH